MKQAKTLFFVYNANSGLLDRTFDGLHKVFSPKTYACQLCSITHGLLGMKEVWKQFQESSSFRFEYHHKDKWEHLNSNLMGENKVYPAVFILEHGQIKELLSAQELNTMQIEDVIRVLSKLEKEL